MSLRWSLYYPISITTVLFIDKEECQYQPGEPLQRQQLKSGPGGNDHIKWFWLLFKLSLQDHGYFPFWNMPTGTKG